jgi:hypothetical protein
MEEGRSLRLDEGLIKGRKDEETMEAKPMEDGRRARLIGIRHIEMLIGLLYI